MARARFVYTELPPSAVSDAELKRHAHLFSNHYGTWGDNPHGLKTGGRVRISASRLQAEHLFDEQRCSLIRATVIEGAAELVVGHACVYIFDVPGKVRGHGMAMQQGWLVTSNTDTRHASATRLGGCIFC